jgi:hypothetical protein
MFPTGACGRHMQAANVPCLRGRPAMLSAMSPSAWDSQCRRDDMAETASEPGGQLGDECDDGSPDLVLGELSRSMQVR